MWDEGVKGNWSRAAEGVMFEIKERREQHPRTSFTAVESAVDGLWAERSVPSRYKPSPSQRHAVRASSYHD